MASLLRLDLRTGGSIGDDEFKFLCTWLSCVTWHFAFPEVHNPSILLPPDSNGLAPRSPADDPDDLLEAALQPTVATKRLLPDIR